MSTVESIRWRISYSWKGKEGDQHPSQGTRVLTILQYNIEIEYNI